MKAILLAAGRSKRFWPLAEKNLFPLCGKALLEHQVERLRSAGITDVLIVVGEHNKESIAPLFPGLTLVIQQEKDKGMQGAMLDALPLCGDEPVMIVGGNDVLDPSAYKTAYEHLEKRGCDGVLLAKRVQRYFPGGYLTLEEGRIAGIVEKPGEGHEPSDLVNIVVHAHASASVLLSALKNASSEHDDGYERALDGLFKTHCYEAVEYDGAWQAVKYPWHLLPLLSLLLNECTQRRIHESVQLHPTAVVEGNVVLEEGVRVLPHASIVGPCVIGKGTVIGNNALVRQSSIGDHCVIGYNTEVKGSVLASHVWTHSTYIGDSVIGENVSFGAGSVTGNLRLDEGEIATMVGEQKLGTGLSKLGTIIGAHVRVGIHTGINPGVKIGSETFVGSGCLVSKDIPEGSFVVMKSGELLVRPNAMKTPRPAARDIYKRKIGPS